MKILLLSDIHANYPALVAIENFFQKQSFAAICNCGDSTVYAPFPNQTLLWLQRNNCYSILGNTDRKVKKCIQGKNFTKPRKAEKRIMYTWTAEQLTHNTKEYLFSLKKKYHFSIGKQKISLFHGSPDNPDEFLFPDTKESRFEEIADSCSSSIILTGHSHMAYHKIINKKHFINPGSVGRMFDGDYRASCAVLHINDTKICVQHYRIEWNLQILLKELKFQKLPQIYQTMFIQGRKLN